jgi:hypothetical protein
MSEATHLSSLAMIDAIHDFNNIAKKYYDIIIIKILCKKEKRKRKKKKIKIKNNLEIFNKN